MKYAIVQLRDPDFRAGPAVVVEITSDANALLKYNGPRQDEYRLWLAYPGLCTGDIVSMKQEGPPQAYDVQPVDGSEVPLEDRLNLSVYQTEVLVSELRNALVPAQHWAKQNKNALRGIDRVLALADALAKKTRGSSTTSTRRSSGRASSLREPPRPADRGLRVRHVPRSPGRGVQARLSGQLKA